MTLSTRHIAVTPFDDQKPGTSGLRKKTRHFMQPDYLETFVAAVFSAIDGARGKRFVLGGDGRFFNDDAIQTIIRMAVAQEVDEIIVGKGGLLSTPAASHLIRKRGADGGFILSASHNPGGIDADFGLKFNAANGGPAPEALTARIYDASKTLTGYVIADGAPVDLSATGTETRGKTRIHIVDPVEDYAALMETLFDFDAIRALFAGGFTMRFDAMHAVTGPYARDILENRLGAAPGTVLNAIPSPDFGGGHPDPNPIWAKPLVDMMMSETAPDFGAASDGDGDRNMIVGRGAYVTPSDSLAILAANAHLAPGYRDGLAGVARSMPTSAAADHVAAARGMACYETPTGWKYFGTLLDAGRVTLCGEESAGTGSNHVREKDGLWAVLMWLNILAATGQSVSALQQAHWKSFGRNYYARHDFEDVPSAAADALMEGIVAHLSDLPGCRFDGVTLAQADEFSYTDPVDGSTSAHQGIRLMFENDWRAVLRLSGTGTSGATIRLYLDRYEPQSGALDLDPAQALAPLRAAVLELAGFQTHIGRIEPDVIT